MVLFVRAGNGSRREWSLSLCLSHSEGEERFAEPIPDKRRHGTPYWKRNATGGRARQHKDERRQGRQDLATFAV